ncbi:response regulator transcription factor [Cohnella soli]|uniref:Response regulator n=1 Tax=Cohnella soli TaxID=425005 RepID=A0ABW0HJR9_9BACL
MNILIVDDEPEIREGLLLMVQELQAALSAIDIAVTAGDGIEALEVMNRYEIDLLITDIRMPRMDGLDLLAQVHLQYPHMNTIIISGFDDFSHIQHALRHGASDYILKPIKQDEFETAINRVHNRIVRTERHNLSWHPDRFTQWEAPFKKLILGDPDNITEGRAQQIGSPQMVSWLFHKIVTEVAEKENKGVCLLQNTDKTESCNMLLGVYGESAEAVDRKVSRITEQIHSFCCQSLRLTASFGISGWIGPDMPDLAEAYRQAGFALLTRIFEGNGIRHSDAIPKKESAKPKVNTDTLSAAMERGDFNSVLDQIAAQMEVLIRCSNVQSLMQGVEIFLLTLHRIMQKQTIDPGKMTVNDLARFMNRLVWSRNARQMTESVLQWATQYLREASIDSRHESYVLSRAKEYMRKNVKLPLTLADVGKLMFVSPNHLSRLFRQEAGITFLEYLTNVRMEEAKRLLKEPGIKIYEVAEMVGYGSWRHFSRTFKETVGYGPSEYRNDTV